MPLHFSNDRIFVPTRDGHGLVVGDGSNTEVNINMEMSDCTITTNTGPIEYQTVTNAVRAVQTHGWTISINNELMVNSIAAGVVDAAINESIFQTAASIGVETNAIHVVGRNVFLDAAGNTRITFRAVAPAVTDTTIGQCTIGTDGIVRGTLNMDVWNPVTRRFHAARPAPHIWKKMSCEQREVFEARERELEERQKAYELQLAEERRLRKIAENKAYDLLMRHLTPEQRDEYERLERFHVVAPGGNIYRIKRGSHGNIKLLEDDGEGLREVESLCVAPGGAIPAFDSMLAQKLWLETDEKEIRRVANIRSLRDFRRPQRAFDEAIEEGMRRAELEDANVHGELAEANFIVGDGADLVIQNPQPEVRIAVAG